MAYKKPSSWFKTSLNVCVLSLILAGLVATTLQINNYALGQTRGSSSPVYSPQPFMNPSSQQSVSPDVRNVMIILDASDSMNEAMEGQTKMQIAKQVVIQTLRSIPPNVNVGLRVYGHRLGGGNRSRGILGLLEMDGVACRQTQMLVPLGVNNRPLIETQLVGLRAVGRTPISYSIQQSVQYDFVQAVGKKAVILVSDGQETCAEDPCDVALAMVRGGMNVKIHTIGFGINDDVVAQNQLKCVAAATKGRFYTADTAAQLAKSLKNTFVTETHVEAKLFQQH